MTWMDLPHWLRFVATGGWGWETSEPGRLDRTPALPRYVCGLSAAL